MPFRFNPIPAGTDPQQQLAILNQNFAELDGEAIVKIIRDPDGKKRVIIGRLPDGTYGILISKEGFDVVDDIINA